MSKFNPNFCPPKNFYKFLSVQVVLILSKYFRSFCLSCFDRWYVSHFKCLSPHHSALSLFIFLFLLLLCEVKRCYILFYYIRLFISQIASIFACGAIIVCPTTKYGRLGVPNWIENFESICQICFNIFIYKSTFWTYVN